MTDSRSPRLTAYCARLTLAAFLATLPGPQAWAQVAAERAVSLPASVAAPLSAAPLSAATALMRSAPLAAPLSAALAAPLAALPAAAAAAVSAPAAASAPTAVAAPAAASALDAAPAAAAPGASAVLRAVAAAADAFTAPHASGDSAQAGASRAFDAAASLSAAVFSAATSGLGAGASSGGSSSDGSGAGAKATPADKADLRTALIMPAQGGELLATESVNEAKRDLGWDAARMARTLEALADDDELARLSGGRYLYTDIEVRASGSYSDATADGANRYALIALKALNHPEGARPAQLAKALVALGKAMKLAPANQPTFQIELASLFRNMAMELGRSSADGRVSALRAQASPDAEALAGAQALQQSLAGIHYDGGKPTAALSADGRSGLIALIEELRPTVGDLLQGDGREAYVGFEMLKTFLAHNRLPPFGTPAQLASSSALVKRADAAPAGGAGATGGGSNGSGGSSAPSYPAEAPIVIFTKIYFPGVHTMNFEVGKDHPAVQAALRHALNNGGYLIAGSSSGSGRHAQATLARIARKGEDSAKGTLTVTVEILRPVKIVDSAKAIGNAPMVKVSYPPAPLGSPANLESLAATVKQLVQQYADAEMIPKELAGQIAREASAVRLANLLAQELPLPDAVKLTLLESASDEARLKEVILELMAALKEKKAAAALAASGAAAPEEVGDISTLEGLQARMKAIGMPASVQKTTLDEFESLSQMGEKDSTAATLREHIKWLVSVPWSRRTTDVFDIPKAKEILDADHSGLQTVKERVLEFLAVRKKTGSVKGKIICFIGPPGTGKTSIAGGIAAALGRKFVRLALGGVHDESVLRGHRRTYVGALPGQIIKKFREAGTVNPVFLLDEIDKLGRYSPSGDPSAALLEILDPKQNGTFEDHYLSVPYDLSEALFVVTANDYASIPEALRDRLEIIEFTGYTPYEKISIAQEHLAGKARAEAGLKPEEAPLTKNALLAVIESFTMEAGVRQLEQVLKTLMNRVSSWTETKGIPVPAVIDTADVETYLGTAMYAKRNLAQNGVGLATGLAVNAYGGSTINIEVSHEPGKGELKLRKQFMDDIDDSARNALKFIKKNAAKYGIVDVDFQKTDLDLNFTPSGKIDGPSAGTLMTTAIISELTGRPVKAGVAMTGEISTRGDVLPIGGLLQKVLAAHRMGIKTVLFPVDNLKDVEKIPAEVRQEMTLIPVRTYDDVYAAAFDAGTTGFRRPAALPPPSAAPSGSSAPPAPAAGLVGSQRGGLFARLARAVADAWAAFRLALRHA